MRQARSKLFWRGAAGVCVAFALAATLRPGSLAAAVWMRRCLLCGPFATADAIRNVLLFLPIGFFLPRALGSTRAAVLAVLGLTACIEAAQLVIPGRDSSPVDILFNFLGGMIGLGLFASRTHWVAPKKAARLALVVAYAACLSLGVLWLGRGSAPTFPEGVLIGQWAPKRAAYVPFDGLIHAAAIGRAPIPAWAIPNGRVTFARFLDGEPLTIRFTRGTYSSRTQLLLRVVMPSQLELLMVGIKGNGIVVRPRTSFTSWRLFEPRTLVPDVLVGAAPGHEVELAVFRSDDQYCVENARTSAVTCASATTAGRLWTLIVNAGGWSPTRVAATAAGLLLLAGVPLGWWGGLIAGLGGAFALVLAIGVIAESTTLGIAAWEALPLLGGALLGSALHTHLSKGREAALIGTDLESAPTRTHVEPGKE